MELTVSTRQIEGSDVRFKDFLTNVFHPFLKCLTHIRIQIYTDVSLYWGLVLKSSDFRTNFDIQNYFVIANLQFIENKQTV